MYFKNCKLTRCLLLLGIYIERKGEREKAGKFQLHFCYPANLWLWRNIVHYLDSSPPPDLSLLHSAFHTSCQFTLLREQSSFLLPLYSLGLLEEICCEKS